MNKTLLPIRVMFIALCAGTGWLVCYTIREWDDFRVVATFIGMSIGVLVVLVDVMLKGFSLRGLSALSFGLAVGSVISYLIGTSPLFIEGDEQIIYLSRLALFLIVTYMCTVIALRGKDEFNLVIPYVRFVPHEVDVPLVVVDTSALIDGRVARICETGFLSGALVIPRFVLEELQRVADSTEPGKQARGRRGLEVLGALRRLKQLDLRIHESEARSGEVDAKLVFLAQSMKAKLLTTDYNLAKMAEFHGVPWLNLSSLVKSMRQEHLVGESIDIDLVKTGREEHQGVGYLDDGSMVVVEQARTLVGTRVSAHISSILPSAGGKIIFAKLIGPAA
ncbi:PIN/TRAM domain-containing protein [Synoicihabitans lomoniglobus]|uniref:PIN domain-containing protein n=1 Tax=Synoicihabitans lomoniglobus TaxID=2909285 RepID=A0AAF0CP32_9BACT|nr:PIN domain-containing protein [Opitutaceae bacterium LMO-M01]WED63289.1 PIN domain-containing protein [Opitutaceae bacterium LMO-M01]